MSYEVRFRRGRERTLIETFRMRAEAETFAGIESMQMEAVGGEFEIRESKRGSL